MKFKHFLLAFSALTITFSSVWAKPYCKLNIRGDEICIKDEVLYASAPAAEANKAEPVYELALVKDIEYPKVVIKVEGEEITTSIDNVVGKQECAAGDHVCKKDKVRLAEEIDACSVGKKEVRVDNVFRNEMIKVQTQKGLFIFGAKEDHVLSLDCVDQVLEN